MALPGYLEETAKDYTTQAAAAYKTPLQPSTFMGEQFVAGEDPLQTQAIGLATSQAGLEGYKPYLAAAQAGLTQAGTDVGAARTTAGGLGALTGAQAYQPFMSPYQQQVIDTSLDEFDRQAKMRQQQMQDATLGVPGAFGGGREGVQLAEYQAGSDRNRLALQAQMLQQGFGQAQTAAQQAFQNQQAIGAGQLGLGQAEMGLGQAQLGLSGFERGNIGQNIGALGQLGSLRQGVTQAQLTADQQMKQAQAYEPYGRLGQWGQGITGLAGGVAGMQYNQPAPQSPWQSALGTALGVGGLFGKIYG